MLCLRVSAIPDRTHVCFIMLCVQAALAILRVDVSRATSTAGASTAAAVFAKKRRRLQHPVGSLGETIAIMVVIVSILMLGWEMLYWLDILPIKLHRHGG